MKRNGVSSPAATNGSAKKRRRTRNDADSEDDDRTSKLSSGSARRSLRSGTDLPESIALPTSRSPSPSAEDKPIIQPLPTWLTTGLSELQKLHPQDSFNGTFNADGEPRVICTDCPGTLYLVHPPSVSNFEPHLRNKKHRENVAARLRLNSVGKPSVGPAPPSFRDQMRHEKSTRVLPDGKSAAILPIKGEVIANQNFSPTVRIAALEKAGAEKDAKIGELERKAGMLEEELRKQGELIKGILGKGKESVLIGDEVPTPPGSQSGPAAQPATVRKKGLSSLFDLFSSPAS